MDSTTREDDTIDAELNPAPAADPGLAAARTSSETNAPNEAPLTQMPGVPGGAAPGGVSDDLIGVPTPPFPGDDGTRTEGDQTALHPGSQTSVTRGGGTEITGQ